MAEDKKNPEVVVPEEEIQEIKSLQVSSFTLLINKYILSSSGIEGGGSGIFVMGVLSIVFIGLGHRSKKYDRQSSLL